MVLGILLSGFFASLGRTIIITAVTGAAVAVTVSGTWGAYMAESAERKSQIKKLERKISINLKKSPIAKAHQFAAIFLSLVNGLPSLGVSLLIILPFFLDFGLRASYYLSIIIAFIFLFLIGVYLGQISKENLVKSGIKLFFIGIICAIIIFLVEHFVFKQ